MKSYWKVVRGMQEVQPAEVDTTSSPSVVYLRRNIARVSEKLSPDDEEETQFWQYEEREMTREEYQEYLLYQDITERIVESTVDTQRQSIIDEYTMELIEGGML